MGKRGMLQAEPEQSALLGLLEVSRQGDIPLEVLLPGSPQELQSQHQNKAGTGVRRVSQEKNEDIGIGDLFFCLMI